MVFWVMLIWIFAVTYLFEPRLCPRTLADDGVYDYRATVGFSVLVFSVPLFFIALRSGFIDTASYIGTFNNAPSDMSQFNDFINKTDKSYFFYALMMYFKNYKNKEDLYQAGYLGIVNAYNNYDASYGCKFSTYAYNYILGEMRKLVRADSR